MEGVGAVFVWAAAGGGHLKPDENFMIVVSDGGGQKGLSVPTEFHFLFSVSQNAPK